MNSKETKDKSSVSAENDHGDPLKPKKPDKPDRKPLEPKAFTIKIDRTEYIVPEDTLKDGKLSGAQLRQLINPPLDSNRDLFEVVAGGEDSKIEDADLVEIRDGQRFFSAPAQINPG